MRKYVLFSLVCVLVVLTLSALVLGAESKSKPTPKAAAGKSMSVTGEVIDTYCYSTMGAKGASHRDCAVECAQKGIPMGLLEDKSNKVYVLLPNKDKTEVPKELIDKMAQKVTITGKVYTSGGSQFLTVESIK